MLLQDLKFLAIIRRYLIRKSKNKNCHKFMQYVGKVFQHYFLSIFLYNNAKIICSISLKTLTYTSFPTSIFFTLRFLFKYNHNTTLLGQFRPKKYTVTNKIKTNMYTNTTLLRRKFHNQLFDTYFSNNFSSKKKKKSRKT